MGRDGAETGRAGGYGAPLGVSAAETVRGTLAGSPGAWTVRDIAAVTGMRRDSVGRVLRLGERAGWARRERDDARRGIGDNWSIAASHEECLIGRDVGSSPRAKMKAAPAPAREIETAGLCCIGAQPPRRLARGELQELVLCLLRDRAPQSFGVVALARLAGGRSQGAVADACERLVKHGLVQVAYESGRRYAARE